MMARYPSIRTLLYFLVVTGFFAVTAQLAKTHGGIGVFREHGMAEQVQFCCTIGSGILLIILGIKHSQARGALVIAGALGLFAGIRELNNTDLYQKIFFNGAVAWVVGIILIGSLLLKFRRGLFQQIDILLRTHAAALLFTGAIIVVGWAQVFAQSSVFPDKEVDRIVEEGLESAGYLLILCGVIELFFNLRRKQSDTDN